MGEDYLLRAEPRGELETHLRALSRAGARPARRAAGGHLRLRRGRQDGDDDEDPDVIGFAGGEIDVGDEVRDEILLALPINPLCKESCRGLCPVCGGNRNQLPPAPARRDIGRAVGAVRRARQA